MSAVRDLNYYLTHTDEMPTDPKEIEALANAHMAAALESGNEQLTVDRFVEADDKAAPSTAAKVEEEKPKEEEKPVEQEKPAEETKPDGILAKDGRNVIPYSQLESARERATAAEALARQFAQELEALKAGTAKPAEQPMLTEDELKALEADSPTLAKVLRSTQSALAETQSEVKALKEHQQKQVADEASEVKSEIQTAIDSNPTLASWQTAEDQAMWNKASAFDQVLRGLPEYKDVPFEDRFKKVVELTNAALGQEVEQPKREEPKLTQEEIKAVAAAKLKAKPALPKSLSDIPGGAPPAADERERVDQMSSVELGSKFLGMTREQLDSYLSNL